jgi:hypothetical protein
LFGFLCEFLSFRVLFVKFLLFGSLGSFCSFIEGRGGGGLVGTGCIVWIGRVSGPGRIAGHGSISGLGRVAGHGSISGLGRVGLCGIFRGFWQLRVGQLLGGIFELLTDVLNVLLGLFEVSLTEFAKGIIEGLDGGFGDGFVLLFDFASELFGVIAGLLQLVGDFLGVASGIAGLFVDSFGKFLLSAGEILKLSGGFSGAIELGFACGLEQFLFALEEIIEVTADFLLFLLQSLAFLCELLIEFFGLLSGFGSGLSLLLEFFGVIREFFGIEGEAIEIGEILFELCCALDFFDGAVEFIAAAIEFSGGLLEVLDGGITFGGSGLVEQFGDVLSYVLGEFGELCGLFLHQRVFAGLFGKSLEFVALSLVFFAEAAGFLASIFVPVAGGLITELGGGGGIFSKLFGHGFEGIDELLIGLPEGLLSECCGVVANANGPRALPDHLRPGNLPLISRSNAKFNRVVLIDTQRLQVYAELVGNFL